MYVNDDRALKKSWEKEINNRKNTEHKTLHLLGSL